MNEEQSKTMQATVDAIYRAESRRVFATLIRLLGDLVRNGRISSTDGPWVETKEQRVCCIEVRPIRPIRDSVAVARQRNNND